MTAPGVNHAIDLTVLSAPFVTTLVDATLVELGNPNCTESADRAIELQPDLWVGYFDRARCKAMSGDYRGAVAERKSPRVTMWHGFF